VLVGVFARGVVVWAIRDMHGGRHCEGGERKDKVRPSGLTPWRCGQIIAFHNKSPRGVPAMAISMYKISVAIFVRHLNGLAHCMKKAQAVYTEKKYDEGTLVNYRLYPDMFTFARQVQQTTDHARNCAAALAGVEAPALEMNEKTLAELIARVEKSLDFLKGLTAAQVDGSEDKKLVVKVMGKDTDFVGIDLLQNRALPNFYFHVTTAYDILRHNGIEIGKRDFMGATA